MSFGTNNKDRTQWQLERVGGYDKQGHVFSIARPLTGSVSFPVKTFPSTAALEQFINEYTFLRYQGCCPTWRSVLRESDCFSDEERDTGTLKGKNYIPEGGKDYVIQLIGSGELVVHRTGSWLQPKDRNHHLPWPKSGTKKEELLPAEQWSDAYLLGPHDGPGGDEGTMEEEGVAPNNNGFIRFTSNYDDHIVFRDFDVPRKRGIGGAHNRDEFLKYSNEFKVEGVVPHPTLDGVETIRYRMSALDRTGNPTGEYRAAVLEKTVYDPSKIPDKQFMDWGRQAAAEAQAAARLNREWVGTTPNGLEFRGYLDDTGAVKSFFPNF